MPQHPPEVENNLASLRQKRGLSAAELARLAGVSRQTIYAMEAGSYVPNTALALKLSRALEATVEEVFSLPGEFPVPPLRTEHAALLPGSEPPQPGQPVELCRVDKRLMAAAPAPVPWYFPASDGIVIAAKDSGEVGGSASVQVFHPESDFQNRILVAGCDPAISVLARHVQAAGTQLVLAHRNSSQALELLRNGSIHVAGTHLRDEASGESNLPAIGRLFSRQSVAVISFAVWEEGILTARGNPKEIRGVEDLARPGVTIVNREAGAGSRKLLDHHFEKLSIPTRKVRGYDRLAAGHLAAAWRVATGDADCCIATRGAARLFGLGFIPLASERYDLVIRRRHLDMACIQTLLDVLNRSAFRRELDTLGGYDTTAAGKRML
jgi:putative molybdopterin biosynthesis protein